MVSKLRSLSVQRLFAILLWLSCLLGASTAQAQSDEQLRVFFFGNSLQYHASNTDETAMPYWLGQIARAADRPFAADGTWGFLRNFAENLPPDPNWSLRGLRRAWSPGRQSFGEAGFDAVVINPANFIQYQPSDTAFDGDNPSGHSPLSATLKVFDWVAAQAPQTKFYIYQGWADLSGVVPYPPDAQELDTYWQANRGSYDQWYKDYVAAIKAARPAMNVQLIPVAQQLAALLTTDPLKALTSGDLFLDDAPHGTGNLYYLAGLITYLTLFESDLPKEMILPRSVHPLIRENYAQIRETLQTDVMAEVKAAKRPTDAIPRPQIPAMALGVSGLSDWSPQYPFLDLMKSARPWIGHKPGEWGGMNMEQMLAGGHLDANGWPKRIPPGIEKIETFILTELTPEAEYFKGRYRLTYDGAGEIALLGRAEQIDAKDGEIWFQFTPGDGQVAISISALDAEDPIHNIRVVHEDHLTLDGLGQQFNPDWLRLIQDFRVLRFMDWMLTNNSPQETWDDRPRVADFSYAWRGVPLDVMLALSNQIGADAWFTLPHKADDDYVRRFAAAAKAGLDPSLHVYAEYSNEVWNFIFEQAQWANEQGRARWRRVGDDAWMQFAGMRAAQMAQIWTEVFGAEADSRLTRVISVHTGWPGLEEPLLTAPQWRKEDRANGIPADYFDAYAVTGYFGHSLGGDDHAQDILGWLAKGEDEATKRSYQTLKNGSVKEITQELFPYHGQAAAKYGLDLIMYEGGTHVAALDGWRNNEALTGFFERFNYSPEMAALYQDVIESFADAGGILFNAFVDVHAPSRWGSWGARRHLWDDNPRWDMIARFNATLPTDWSTREPSVFANGVTVLGANVDDVVEGSRLADTLDAAAGDDWILPQRGPDLIHGGAGLDTVVLPGAFSHYAFFWQDDRLIAQHRDFETQMMSVEQLEFTDDPGLLFAISPVK